MKVMISGGGTGGHIYPALALIRQLKARNLLTDILYVGTENGLEERIIREQGLPFAAIELQGFKRSLSLDNFRTVALFIKSTKRAKQLIREFKPDIVIGTGGYVSSSILYEAARLHIPTLIHEQNSVAGVTNKFLGKIVDKVAIAFPSVAESFPLGKVVLTGNPRAQEVSDLKPNSRLSQFGLKEGVSTVMIFGGSRGAPAINKATVDSLSLFKMRDYQVLFVTGEGHFEDIKKIIGDSYQKTNIAIVPYIDDMPNILPDLQLIVGRAGATSLAEITALGLPAVLIPSPYVTNDHQTKNAMAMAKVNAAKVIKQDDLNATSLIDAIDQIMTNQKVQMDMSLAAKSLGEPNAADKVIEIMEQLVQSK